MAKTRIGTNAQFIGGNKSLTMIGDHCYAYSGSLVNDTGAGSADQTLLLFATGKEYIKAKFQFTTTQSSGHDFYADIFFNNVTVVQIKEDSSDVEGFPIMIRLIIPPLTTVEVKVGSNTTGHYNQCNVVGKVYS